MRKLRDYGLSIVVLSLFLVTLVGQCLSGHAHFNENQHDHGRPPVSLGQYLSSPAFAEALFENWESEFLQMAVYVWLTSFLFQRGSAESKDPDDPEGAEESTRVRPRSQLPYPVRAGGLLLKVYENSLSLSLFLLFLVSFVLHWIGSARQQCVEDSMHGKACSTALSHFTSATFWFESFQNWQSEFLSIAVLVLLSIFLRQKGSPASKDIDALHSETGK